MSKKKKKQNKKMAVLVAVVVILSIAAVAFGIFALKEAKAAAGKPGQETDPVQITESPAETEPAAAIEDLQDVKPQRPDGLQVTKIGSYTGLYVEDGSDEILSRILMILVENTGSATVQYAQIQLTDGTDTAHFALTTLPPGEKMVVLEQNRMPYTKGQHLDQITIENVALFPQEPELHSDQLEIQPLDGFLNVKNISGADITEDVVIYYKNASADVLYGGITYRITLQGGLKADEVAQLAAGHFTAKGSRVMFITIG
jgi:hypothetical protein